MTCKDCIHYAVCKEHEKIMLTVNNLYELIYQSGVEVSCKHFSTADVVSKSEVEELEKEVERLTAILNSYALQYFEKVSEKGINYQREDNNEEFSDFQIFKKASAYDSDFLPSCNLRCLF